MAKISARGCHKIARATRERDSDGLLARDALVLRSDGAVLRKTDLRHARYGGGFSWSRGTYSVAGKLSDRDGRTAVERFGRYAGQRGYIVD